MKKPSQHKWIRLTAAALSLSLLAAVPALVLEGTAGPLRNWGETVSRPFLRLFSPVSEALRGAEDRFRGMEALRRENAALKEENARLEAAAIGEELARRENENLRALLGWKEGHPDLVLAPARVLDRPPEAWDRTLTLDKGEADGIRTGQQVVEAHGALVGLVDTLGKDWCRVTLVTSPELRLSALGTVSGALGTLEGDLARMEKGELLFTVLSPDQPLSLGEGLVTRSPAGGALIPVGRVTSLAEDPGGLRQVGVVTPTAHLEGLSQVFVVTGFREGRG